MKLAFSLGSWTDPLAKSIIETNDTLDIAYYNKNFVTFSDYLENNFIDVRKIIVSDIAFTIDQTNRLEMFIRLVNIVNTKFPHAILIGVIEDAGLYKEIHQFNSDNIHIIHVNNIAGLGIKGIRSILVNDITDKSILDDILHKNIAIHKIDKADAIVDLDKNKNLTIEDIKVLASYKLKKKGFLPKKGCFVITGERCSGITTSIVNIAEVFRLKNMQTIIIDLNLLKRDYYLFYKGILDEELRNHRGNFIDILEIFSNKENVHINDFNRMIYVVRQNLGLIGVSGGYCISSTELSLMRSVLICKMISVLKSAFDIILIDCPLNSIKEFLGNFSDIDKVCIIVDSSISSILNISLYNNILRLIDSKKLGLLINKFYLYSRFNGISMTEDTIRKLFTSINSELSSVNIIGNIPFLNCFFDSNFGSDNILVDRDPRVLGLYEAIAHSIA